jgi:dienelactone hydrolase
MAERSRPTILAILLAGLLAAACTSRVHYPRAIDNPIPSRSAAKTDTAFVYKKQSASVSTNTEWQTDTFRVQAFSMKSIGRNGQAGDLVTARYFQSRRAGPKPLIIVLPLWGVDPLPSTAMSRYLTDEGEGSVHVLQLHGHYRLFDMERTALAWAPQEFMSLMDEMAHRIVNTVIDIRRIVDWAETRPEIDRRRIALNGFSLSAMVASVALSNEPRLSGGILAMGGASPHISFAACGGAAGQMREMITTRFKWSDDHYRKVIKTPLSRVDPARFGGRVDPRHILIFEAGDDTCIPESARRTLWEAMGRPERIVYPYDHRTAFLAMTILGGRNLQKDAYQFLAKLYGLDSRR